MPYRTLEGKLDSSGLRFAIVVSRFNSLVTERLLSGAVDALLRTGCVDENIVVARIPGSWELPVVAAELARSKQYDALICLSAIIRGDTPHFDYIAAEATKGLGQISMETGVPVSFGVLTTNTLEQAIDRAGAKSGNKGFEAAMAAIETANVLRSVRNASV